MRSAQEPIRIKKAGSDPGLFFEHTYKVHTYKTAIVSSRLRLQRAGEQPRRDPLGLAGTAKQPALKLIETMIGGEKAITSFVANDDSCSFRTDFDDVCV